MAGASRAGEVATVRVRADNGLARANPASDRRGSVLPALDHDRTVRGLPAAVRPDRGHRDRVRRGLGHLEPGHPGLGRPGRPGARQKGGRQHKGGRMARDHPVGETVSSRIGTARSPTRSHENHGIVRQLSGEVDPTDETIALHPTAAHGSRDPTASHGGHDPTVAHPRDPTDHSIAVAARPVDPDIAPARRRAAPVLVRGPAVRTMVARPGASDRGRRGRVRVTGSDRNRAIGIGLRPFRRRTSLDPMKSW